MPFVKKPGFMLRAVIAWMIYNSILILTLAAVVYLVLPYMREWYVMLPLLVAVVASEWIIMSETVAPVIQDWIKQESYVSDDKR